jgi:hypothetical protein
LKTSEGEGSVVDAAHLFGLSRVKWGPFLFLVNMPDGRQVTVNYGSEVVSLPNFWRNSAAFKTKISSEKVAGMWLAKRRKKVNPWAVCTESVGRDDKEKYERCVLKVKEQQGMK